MKKFFDNVLFGLAFGIGWAAVQWVLDLLRALLAHLR